MSRTTISATSLSTWLSCRQQAFWKKQGWEPIQTKASLNFGALIHICLEYAYNKLSLQVRREGIHAVVLRTGLPAFLKKYEREFCRGLVDERSIEEAQRFTVEAGVLIPEYFAHWKDGFPNKSKSALSVNGVEVKFEIPYDKAEDIWLLGYVDGVAHSIDRFAWIMETKTMAEISDTTMELLAQIAFQNRFYVYALERLFQRNPPQEKFKGVVYNIIRRPMLKLGKQTLEEYEGRLRADVKANPSFYFRRVPIAYTEAEKREFAESFQVQAAEYVKWLKGFSPTYRNNAGGVCVGRWMCPYVEACANPTKDIRELGLYQTRKGDGGYYGRKQQEKYAASASGAKKRTDTKQKR